MTRLARVAAAALLLFAVAAARDLALPRSTFACSCAQRDVVALVKGNPDDVVVAGVMVDVRQDQLGNQTGTLVVGRLFQGPVGLGARVPLVSSGNMCSAMLKDGLQVLMNANLQFGRLSPAPCGLFADLQTPEGRALLAETTRAFGIALPGGDDPSAGIDLALVAIGLAGGLFVTVMFGAIVLTARRRDGPPVPEGPAAT